MLIDIFFLFWLYLKPLQAILMKIFCVLFLLFVAFVGSFATSSSVAGSVSSRVVILSKFFIGDTLLLNLLRTFSLVLNNNLKLFKKDLLSCNSTISFNLARIKSFIRFCGNMPSICFNLLEESRNFIASTCFSVCFSKAFSKGEYANLACSIICF